MDIQIRTGSDEDIAELVPLSLLAWEPVFDSFRQVMGPEIYTIVFPEWQATQKETVETYCAAREDRTLLIAEVDGKLAGFLVYELNHKDKTGVVQLLAVHPHYQNGGIGTELNDFALVKMKESGMKLASVSTGGDPGHAPARRAYEKAGYTAIPQVWYCKAL
ncbi:MAG: GNAT family N-acetyltransferase [Caldilineaceae bacterium]|nr:GNAT family N-acetyltransferase [Caldilineaceae bacterium]